MYQEFSSGSKVSCFIILSYIVAYKDRLTRFGFELIEDLIKEYSNGRIIILHKNKDLEPEEELVKDIHK
jgi:predicted site-specific integrase-resolvase